MHHYVPFTPQQSPRRNAAHAHYAICLVSDESARVPLISRVTLIAGFRHLLEQFMASVTQTPVKAAAIVIIELHN